MMSTTVNTSSRNHLNKHLDIDGDDILKDMDKPFKHITSVPGKAIRENLAEIFRQWITVSDEKIEKIKTIIYYAHNMSLMVDDIQDFSELRRGVPAAHTLYGIPRTIISANWSCNYNLQILENLDNEEFTELLFSVHRHAYAGQGMELYWRDNHICPTQEEYLQMIFRKTGSAFNIIVKSLNMFTSGKKLDAHRLITILGIYFQINDDYQNLHNQIYHDSKGFCEDISEGKYSFPVIHAIRNFPEEGKEIEEILKMRTTDIEIKKRCLFILEKCGSFEYTRMVLKELKTELDKELGKLEKNPLMEEFLQKAFLYNL